MGVPLDDCDLTRDAFLGGALSILQPARGYRAGLDAVLLAAASPEAASHVGVLDAGAGVGVAGLCYANRIEASAVVLLEKAPELAALARRNVALNGLQQRVMVAETDITATAAEHEALGLGPELFDIILANPPYDETGKGRAPLDPIKAAANAMPAGDLDRWMRFAARVAVPDGTLVLIHRADALARVLEALDGRFGALQIMPVHPRQGAPAHRILALGRKGSRAPLTLHSGLVLHGEGNAFLPAIDRILRQGAALDWPFARPT